MPAPGTEGLTDKQQAANLSVNILQMLQPAILKTEDGKEVSEPYICKLREQAADFLGSHIAELNSPIFRGVM